MSMGTQLLRFLFYVNLDWHLEVKLDQLYSTSFYTSLHSLGEKVRESVAQSCPTLCDLLDYRPPRSSVHGILQAKALDLAAIPFSRGSS